MYFGAGPGTPAERFQYYRGIGSNSSGLSRKHIIEGAKASLKRLQTSYFDILFASRPDRETPLEEICRAFSWEVNNNLNLYWVIQNGILTPLLRLSNFAINQTSIPLILSSESIIYLIIKIEKDDISIFEKFGF